MNLLSSKSVATVITVTKSLTTEDRIFTSYYRWISYVEFNFRPTLESDVVMLNLILADTGSDVVMLNLILADTGKWRCYMQGNMSCLCRMKNK